MIDDRLRRIEGMLAMLLREQAEREDAREEATAAYRRGYLAGRASQRRGDDIDVDAAVARRRKVRR